MDPFFPYVCVTIPNIYIKFVYRSSKSKRRWPSFVFAADKQPTFSCENCQILPSRRPHAGQGITTWQWPMFTERAWNEAVKRHTVTIIHFKYIPYGFLTWLYCIPAPHSSTKYRYMTKECSDKFCDLQQSLDLGFCDWSSLYNVMYIISRCDAMKFINGVVLMSLLHSSLNVLYIRTRTTATGLATPRLIVALHQVDNLM